MELLHGELFALSLEHFDAVDGADECLVVFAALVHVGQHHEQVAALGILLRHLLELADGVVGAVLADVEVDKGLLEPEVVGIEPCCLFELQEREGVVAQVAGIVGEFVEGADMAGIEGEGMAEEVVSLAVVAGELLAEAVEEEGLCPFAVGLDAERFGHLGDARLCLCRSREHRCEDDD